MATALAVKYLESLKLGPKRRDIPDGLLPGLYFIIQPSGKRSWAARYRFGGKPCKLTLGAYPAIDLKGARELAREALAKVAGGIDPRQEKKAAKAAAAIPANDLVEAVAARFVSHYAKRQLKAATAKEVERLLEKEVVEPWRGRGLSQIGRAEIHELLDAIVERGSPVTANRTLAWLRRLCSWAVERGLITATPCTGIRAPASETARDRVFVRRRAEGRLAGRGRVGTALRRLRQASRSGLARGGMKSPKWHGASSKWRSLAHATAKDIAYDAANDPFKNATFKKVDKQFHIVKVLAYTDENGAELFEVCRLENGEVGTDGKPQKRYLQRHKDPSGYINNVKGIRQVPYRLPELIRAVEQLQIIFITEGEKCADAIIALGGAATCNAMGAGKWLDDITPFFKNADVVILPDNDEPSEKHRFTCVMCAGGRNAAVWSAAAAHLVSCNYRRKR